MLIKCPECELQVSDKALQCPHCGYPMTPESKPFTQSRSNKHKRLPNGFGQITEIKNKNLRNRFRVMITVSKTTEGKPIAKLLKPKAYFSTYNEAYTALVEYNRDPYDLNSIMTMEELYDKWSKEKYKKCSPGAKRAYKSAWNYSSLIHDLPLRAVRARHLKECIETAHIIKNGEKIEATPGVKSKMKILFNMLFDYAVEYELTDKNYSRAFSLSEDIQKEIEETRVNHISFDEWELKIMWDHVDEDEYLGYILYQCYSGWRPTEMCLLRVSDVHLDEGYVVGGIKTESGKDRIVPIHPKVRYIVEREYNRAKELKSEWLFNNLGTTYKNSKKISYTGFRRIFNRIMDWLNLNPEHRPHDPRKTFITLAKKYNMDEYALKRIVGHAINDITESIYTDRPLEWYIKEIQKIG